MLAIRNISLRYPSGKLALEGLNFEVNVGEMVGLVGNNGAGKSTLIHVLAGVLKPTNGEVEIWLTDHSDIAWVSQKTTIDWYLNVYNNVLLGAKLGGLYGNEAHAKTQEMLELVGLKHEMHAPSHTLSGGQQKRVQIARALAQRPRLIILDEPTTGLDPIASKKLLQTLKSMAQSGATVLICSHDLALLEEYVDRIICMKDGAVTEDAPLAKLLGKGKGRKSLSKIYEKVHE